MVAQGAFIFGGAGVVVVVVVVTLFLLLRPEGLQASEWGGRTARMMQRKTRRLDSFMVIAFECLLCQRFRR